MNNLNFTFYVVPRNKSIKPYFCSCVTHLNSDSSYTSFLDYLEDSISNLDDMLLKEYGFDELFDVFIHFGDISGFLGINTFFDCVAFDSLCFNESFTGDVGTR